MHHAREIPIAPDQNILSCPACRRHWTRDAQLFALPRDSTGVELSPDTIRYAAMLSPLGLVWIAADDRGWLQHVEFGIDEARFCWEVERESGRPPVYCPEALADVVRQLEEYFAGRRQSFDLQLDLARLRPFQRAVLEAVFAIPYGDVRSYGEIATTIGKPRAARAVGGAVGSNPLSLVIPCHRVVRSDGSLGEYGLQHLGSCGPHYKQLLLRLEGSSLE